MKKDELEIKKSIGIDICHGNEKFTEQFLDLFYKEGNYVEQNNMDDDIRHHARDTQTPTPEKYKSLTKEQKKKLISTFSNKYLSTDEKAYLLKAPL